MKKFIFNLFLVFVLYAVTAVQGFCANSETYKFVPIVDKKTKVEFARVLVPEKFNVTSDTTWERDFEEPVYMTVLANSPSDDVAFFYASQKSYIDDEKLVKDSAKKIDTTLHVINKKYVEPEEYITDFILKNAPEAKDIKVYSSKTCQNDLKHYLISELFKEIEDFRTNIKTDRKSSKIEVNNPSVEPYVVTYTYSLNGKNYKQTFITMFTSIDFNITKRTSYDFYETKLKKLWSIVGFYSYRAEEKDYNDHLNDFIIFTANSIANQKAIEAIKCVKSQMVMELNPNFSDVHTGSPLRNLPSDLFRRFYEGGLVVYTEDEPMQKPSIDQIKWLVEYITPLNCYNFSNITKMRNQKLYVPQEYAYVYFNTVKNKVLISRNKPETKGTWVKLKFAKINYNEK